MGHRIKQINMNVRNRYVGKEDRWRQEDEVRLISMRLHMYETVENIIEKKKRFSTSSVRMCPAIVFLPDCNNLLHF